MKAVMNFNHIEGYGALMEKKLSLHVCSFSSPKGSMIYNTAHQGNIQLVYVPPLHQTEEGWGREYHFTFA